MFSCPHRGHAERLFEDVEEFDFEDERSCGTSGHAFVGEIFRNPEDAFFADDHELQGLGPTGDDLVETEDGGFAAHDAGVEELSIGGPAGIMDADAARRGGMFCTGAFLRDAPSDAGFGFLRIGVGGGDVFGGFRRLWGGDGLDDFEVEDEHAGEFAIGGNAEFLRNPDLEGIADVGIGEDGFPSREKLVNGGFDGGIHFGGRLESIAGLLHPPRELESDEVAFAELSRVWRGLGDAIGETVVEFDGVFWDIFRRHDGGNDVEDVEIKDEHAGGTTWCAAVGEVFGDPETGFFAFFHEHQTFFHAGDEVCWGENGGRLVEFTRIEHMTIGGPTGVVDFDEVIFGDGDASVVGGQFFVGETGDGFLCIGGGGSDVGGGWNFGFHGGRRRWKCAAIVGIFLGIGGWCSGIGGSLSLIDGFDVGGRVGLWGGGVLFTARNAEEHEGTENKNPLFFHVENSIWVENVRVMTAKAARKARLYHRMFFLFWEYRPISRWSIRPFALAYAWGMHTARDLKKGWARIADSAHAHRVSQIAVPNSAKRRKL